MGVSSSENQLDVPAANPEGVANSSRRADKTSGAAHRGTASACGNLGLWAEFNNLTSASRIAADRIESDIARECVEVYDPAKAKIEAMLKRPLAGCQALEIGPGQWLAQARYFGRWAKVTGIDLDVLPSGLDIPGYWRMYRSNGVRRVLKTLARKAMGFDRRIVAAYDRAFGKPLHEPRVMRMDATATTFKDNTFDVTYSFNVLEHIPQPEAVFKEAGRILRSGGVLYHDIHLYTSDTGCHDPRVVVMQRGSLPFWPHLHAHSRKQLAYGGYLNKLRLAEWHQKIASELPGAEVIYRHDAYVAEPLALARSRGELGEYSDDELTVRNIIVAWRKP